MTREKAGVFLVIAALTLLCGAAARRLIQPTPDKRAHRTPAHRIVTDATGHRELDETLDETFEDPPLGEGPRVITWEDDGPARDLAFCQATKTEGGSPTDGPPSTDEQAASREGAKPTDEVPPPM